MAVHGSAGVHMLRLARKHSSFAVSHPVHFLRMQGECTVLGQLNYCFFWYLFIYEYLQARSPEASQDWKKASRCLCYLAVLAYFSIIIGGGVGYAIYYLVKVRHIQLS